MLLLLTAPLMWSMSQVHVVIQGYETGAKHEKSFSASYVTSIYNKHMTLLGMLIDRKLGAYHRLMAGLFQSALYGSLTDICLRSDVRSTGMVRLTTTVTLMTSLPTSTLMQWKIDWTARSQRRWTFCFILRACYLFGFHYLGVWLLPVPTTAPRLHAQSLW